MSGALETQFSDLPCLWNRHEARPGVTESAVVDHFEHGLLGVPEY